MTMDIMVVIPATMVASTTEEAIIVVDTIATAATLDTATVVVITMLPSPAVGATVPRSPTTRQGLTAAADAVATTVKASVASKWNLGTIDSLPFDLAGWSLKWEASRETIQPLSLLDVTGQWQPPAATSGVVGVNE